MHFAHVTHCLPVHSKQHLSAPTVQRLRVVAFVEGLKMCQAFLLKVFEALFSKLASLWSQGGASTRACVPICCVCKRSHSSIIHAQTHTQYTRQPHTARDTASHSAHTAQHRYLTEPHTMRRDRQIQLSPTSYTQTHCKHTHCTTH